MLSKRYRFVAENDSGSSLSDIKVWVAPWTFDSDGVLEYQTEQEITWATPPTSGGGIAEPEVDVDNRTVLAQGAHCQAEITGLGTGDVHFYLQLYVEASGWPTEGTLLVATISNPAEAAGNRKIVDFEI